MKKYLFQKLQEVHLELKTINMENGELPLEIFKDLINYLENTLLDIREYLLCLDAISEEEEIYLFKEVKPQILGSLLYFNKIHGFELKCPTGSLHTVQQYYQRELESLTFFFERNSDFYQYYRSKATHMDGFYFLRNSPFHPLSHDSIHFILDSDFSTGYDYKVAKIICNEKLSTYLNKKIQILDKQTLLLKTGASLPTNNLKWTGSKVALVEIGYSFQAGKFINRGHADIKEIMTGLEVLFNIDLGDYYRSYVAIKERKIDRTKYLNQLSLSLLNRMDQDD